MPEAKLQLSQIEGPDVETGTCLKLAAHEDIPSLKLTVCP